MNIKLVFLVSRDRSKESTPVTKAPTGANPSSPFGGDGQSDFIYYYFNILGGLKIDFTKQYLFKHEVQFPKNTYSKVNNQLGPKAEKFQITQNASSAKSTAFNQLILRLFR